MYCIVIIVLAIICIHYIKKTKKLNEHIKNVEKIINDIK